MNKNTIARKLTLVGAALTLLLGFGVAQAPTFTVTTAADSESVGACTPSACGTLRNAIYNANSDASPPSTINFNIPSTHPGCPAANVCTILLGSTLPTTTGTLTIIDSTFSGNTASDAGAIYLLGNTASLGAGYGGAIQNFGSATFYNTILAKSTGENCGSLSGPNAITA
jgi:hypothetical protein